MTNQKIYKVYEREVRGAIAQCLHDHPDAKLKDVQSSLIKRILGQLCKEDVQKALVN